MGSKASQERVQGASRNQKYASLRSLLQLPTHKYASPLSYGQTSILTKHKMEKGKPLNARHHGGPDWVHWPEGCRTCPGEGQQRGRGVAGFSARASVSPSPPGGVTSGSPSAREFPAGDRLQVIVTSPSMAPLVPKPQSDLLLCSQTLGRRAISENFLRDGSSSHSPQVIAPGSTQPAAPGFESVASPSKCDPGAQPQGNSDGGRHPSSNKHPPKESSSLPIQNLLKAIEDEVCWDIILTKTPFLISSSLHHHPYFSGGTWPLG